MKVKIYSVCFVMAFLSGVSFSLAQCEPACGGEIFAHHPASEVAPITVDITYSTVEYDGKCWITQNLGATQEADSVYDSSDAAAGWYWQFNRKQGYSWNTSDNTRTPNTIWITSISEDSDWLSENDPCTLLLGSDWHIPTSSEWDGILALGAWSNCLNAYNSPLKLHEAGYILPSDEMAHRAIGGLYWSCSDFTDPFATRIYLTNNSITSSNVSKTNGLSVRCCKSL